MWLTIGEFYRECGICFPVESLRDRLRVIKAPHLEGSWPYKYRREDLEDALEYVKTHSLFLRNRFYK